MSLATLIGVGGLIAAACIGIYCMVQDARTICAHCGGHFCDGVQCADDAPVTVPAGPAESDLLAPWRAFIESL